MIDLRATAAAGQVMILTVIIAWLVEVAQGAAAVRTLAGQHRRDQLVAIVIQRLRG